MTTLSKTETKLLLDAATGGGSLILPSNMKAITRDRLLGRFEAEGLILVAGDDAEPRLTPAGYRAVGLRPPRRKRKDDRARVVQGESGPGIEPRSGLGGDGDSAEVGPRTKRALISELLGRHDGASLIELMAATGWLPHTTRAALSRIRSAGQPLAKSKRPDGSTAYRIGVAEAA